MGLKKHLNRLADKVDEAYFRHNMKAAARTEKRIHKSSARHEPKSKKGR